MYVFIILERRSGVKVPKKSSSAWEVGCSGGRVSYPVNQVDHGGKKEFEHGLDWAIRDGKFWTEEYSHLCV